MHCDVAIIGGGPAGCTAAMVLARRGLRVTVIERMAFPRTKVCGEFISPAVAHLIAWLLGPEALKAAGAVPVGTLEVWAGGRCALRWPMPRQAVSLSRGALDAMLLERARDAGVEIRQPATVVEAMYHPEHVDLHLASGAAMRAKVVVHADGTGRHDPAGSVRMRPNVLGLKCHLHAADSLAGILQLHTVSHAAGRGYFGVVAVESGRATLAMAVDARLVRAFRGDHDAMLAAVCPAASHWHRAGDWLACGVPEHGYRGGGHPRSLRIGNAAAAVEPVGGEGIGLALWSGSQLGAALDLDDLPTGARRFGRAYRRRLRWRRAGCRLAAQLLASPRVMAAAVPLLGLAPGLLLRPLYHLTGKPIRA